jgi:hypothetical protein
MTRILKLSGFTLASTLSAATVQAGDSNLIDDLFAPFAGINISQTYDAYSSIIDFVIYSILFVGLSQATLGKRFEGRGGKMVVSAIGFIMAIGLSITEAQLGFSLRSFGVLAAVVFILLVGVFVYQAIKMAGMGFAGSGSIALIITYFSIRAITPEFFNWMMSNPYMSWLHAVLVVAVMIAIVKVVKLLLPPKGDKSLFKSAKELAKKSVKAPKEMLDQIHAEKNEKHFIKARLEKITEIADKTSQQMLEDLLEMRKLIEEFGATAKGQYLLAQKIEQLAPKEHQVLKILEALKQRVQKLATFDHQHFDKLRDEYHKMSAEARKLITDELRDEWKKLDAEKKMMALEDSVGKYDHHFTHAVKMVTVALKSQRQKDALSWVDEAIKWERHVQKAMQELEVLEKKLLKYTKREIKDEKREVKAVKKATPAK